MEQLGINLGGLATQIVAFLLFGLILYIVLHKPITQGLDRRSDRIRESLEAAERAQKQIEESKHNAEVEIQKARIEGQKIISEAQNNAKRVEDLEIANAYQRAQEIISQAHSQIKQERDTAFDELRTLFADLTISASEKLIGSSFDKATHEKLIHSIITQELKDKV